jgi:uncharacterized protein (TIGR01777 family)
MLVRAFRSEGHHCVVLSRKPAPDRNEVFWDGRTLGPWVAELEGADAIINLAGRSVDCRYHKRNLSQMMDSRVDSTRIIGQAIAQATNPPRVWLQAATATIYAHRFDAPNDEETGVIGGHEPGVPALWGKSIDIAQAWEAEVNAAATPRTRKVILRSAMTMSPDRGGVFHVLATLCRLGVGRQGDGRQYVSWIHEHDFVAGVKFLIARDDLAGAFNLAAPQPLPNREFMAGLHAALGRRLSIPVPAWALEIGAIFLRTETELILKSRRVVPSRLLKAGFVFEYPTWPAAAVELARRWKTGEPRIRKFTRGKRIAVEVLAPPLLGGLGSIVLSTGISLWEGAAWGYLLRDARNYLLITLTVAYVVGLLPSLAYMAAMEAVFTRGLDPRGWRATAFSGFLGLAAGVGIMLFFGRGQTIPADLLVFITADGLAVGLLVGLYVRWRSRGAET